MSPSSLSHVFGPRSFPPSRIILSAGSVLLVAATLTSSPAGAQLSSSNGTPVTPAESLGDMRTFPAILLPGCTALLRTEYDGVLEEVHVAVGDQVHKGELLVQLVAEEERVERERARTLLEKAEVDLERARKLHARGGTSDDALENAETTYNLAKADLELASIRFEEHYIRAPFDGVVAERYVDPGASVEEGDPLVRVTALTPLRLEALLPETMLAAFSGPTFVQLRMCFPDSVITVPVDLEAIVVDPASGTFPLQIEVDNSAGRLVPGVSCTVAIPTVAKRSP